MTIYGLISNFIGAILLVIGTSIQTKSICKIIDTIADKLGYWEAEPIPTDLIKKFRSQNKLSSWLNLIGYLLFIGGFLLQLIGLAKICP